MRLASRNLGDVFGSCAGEINCGHLLEHSRYGNKSQGPPGFLAPRYVTERIPLVDVLAQYDQFDARYKVCPIESFEQTICRGQPEQVRANVVAQQTSLIIISFQLSLRKRVEELRDACCLISDEKTILGHNFELSSCE